MTERRLAPSLPDALAPFLEATIQAGFSPSLVGGAVRDLLMGETGTKDWDFELRYPKAPKVPWDKLLHQLRMDYRLTPQPHHVVKAFHASTRLEFEFAPPRRDVYPAKEIYAHSDFESQVSFDLPFEESCRRRDFTINAMGASFDGTSWLLQDPLGGALHLGQRELHPCSSDFPKDPVRFLRAHRFALKYALRFSHELALYLEQMDLGLLSSHYVSEEAAKSLRPFRFWNALQVAATLPTKFQGGLLADSEMDAIYARYQPKLGHSNGLLAAVFATNDGWHLLLPLAGKGEKETAGWRERREILRQLKGRRPQELLDDQQALVWLCHLTRAPFQWVQESWVGDVLAIMDLSWIAERPWPETDLRSIPPADRPLHKVRAWLTGP